MILLDYLPLCKSMAVKYSVIITFSGTLDFIYNRYGTVVNHVSALHVPMVCVLSLYLWQHCNEVLMSAMVSPITGASIVCSTVCSGADQRKCQNSASLAFVRGIHQWPVDSPHKEPVTRKIFQCDDAIIEFLAMNLSNVDGFLSERTFAYPQEVSYHDRQPIMLVGFGKLWGVLH